ncbi:MAG: hypothetical protein KatS3mg105_2706 [Gemmatales bacterium]|nr:MAG: hypothetical protein KatS3mg105_2706 [Gemmatales bacterium]
MTQQPMANAVSRLSMCVLLLMVGSVEAAELPSDLDAVPRNAAMFVHVRAADIWNHELLQDTRYLLSQAGPQAIKRFRDMFAPDVATIDRVTLVWQSIDAMGGWFPNGDPTQESAVTIIHTKRPYDFSRVTSKVGLRDKFHRRKHYFFNEESWSGMVLLDRQTIAIGSEEAIFRFLDARETADSQGPLQFALELAAGKAHLTFGFNPKVLSDAGLLKVVPPSLQGMFMAKWWAGSLSLGKPLEARISFSYHQAKDAETGEKAVRAALELVRTQLLSDIQNMERLIGRDKEKVTFSDLPERFAILLGLGFFRELDRLLKTAPIQRTGGNGRHPLAIRPFVEPVFHGDSISRAAWFRCIGQLHFSGSRCSESSRRGSPSTAFE